MRQSDEDWVILCHRHQADEMAKQDPDYAIRSNINNTNIFINNANINTINMVTTQIIVAKAPPFSQVHMNTLQGSLQCHIQRKLPDLDHVYSGHN